jgi:hypothetical protein
MSYLLLESGDKIVLEAGDGFLLLDEVTANVAGTVLGGTSAVGAMKGGTSLVGTVTGGISVG